MGKRALRATVGIQTKRGAGLVGISDIAAVLAETADGLYKYGSALRGFPAAV
jgi:hypothetical protein